MKYRITLLLLACLLSRALLVAQTIPVGTPVLEDYYRRAQLLGLSDTTQSFTCRPFFPAISKKAANPFDPDRSLRKTRTSNFDGIFRFDKNRGMIQLLPVQWLVQYNTHHPYSLNDGAMIPARGFQTLFSAGVYAKYGPLSIQLRPEVVYAGNRIFDGFPTEHPDDVWKAYYTIYNQIDLPERFGDGSYQKVFWGQSSVRLTFGPASLGLSNENLWWGPGRRNSLLMSNTAPGFKHLTLNTIRPVKTPIGSFEGQLIAGRLDSSGFRPPMLERNGIGAAFYRPKPNDWRYLNGIVLSYQPRWVQGLFLGATRVFQTYRGDMGNALNDYLPVIIPLTKKQLGEQEENAKKRDQIASVFARWVWLQAHAEIYFEYGREDHAWDGRDVFLQPEHARAYILGFRKLAPLKNHPDQAIEVVLEATQLQNTYSGGTRGQSSWYLHTQLVHGYTQLGQLLGAGIGPGSNMQTLSVTWVKSLKTIGIQLERYVHDNDFHNEIIKDIRANWVDFCTSLFGTWDFGHFLLTARLDAVESFNYEHLFVQADPAVTDFWTHGKTVFNLQGMVGMVYRF
ncbi:MAG: capsule assembly Wzi family protein [Bacteroidales bacterium]|jgi:hypothetical protein